MIRFNWELLKRNSGGDCKRLVTLIKIISGLATDREIKDNKEFILRLQTSKSLKDSFLINPKDLIESREAYTDICTYIWLASLRNYANYSLYGSSTLPYYTVQQSISIPQVSNNRLLLIENKEIIFKYE